MDSKYTTRSLLTHYEAHPIVLDIYALKNFGPEYYTWEPETLWTELQRTAKTNSVSDVNKNKYQAIRTIHRNTLVYDDWVLFEKVIAAVNGVIVTPSMMQKPNLGQLWSGVNILRQLRSGIFSDEVSRYTTAALLSDGIQYVPPPLTFCHYLLKRRAKLFGEVENAYKDEKPTDNAYDEAVQFQLNALRTAKMYAGNIASKLLEQITLVQ